MNKQDDQHNSLKVIEEQVHIDKQVIEKSKVRLSKKVHEENETVSVSVKSEEVKVEKLEVNKYVDEVPQVRYEGNTMIVPVMKEVLVIEKKLLLVEEFHITKYITTKEEEKTIPLRKEEVIIERIASNDSAI